MSYATNVPFYALELQPNKYAISGSKKSNFYYIGALVNKDTGKVIGSRFINENHGNIIDVPIERFNYKEDKYADTRWRFQPVMSVPNELATIDLVFDDRETDVYYLDKNWNMVDSKEEYMSIHYPYMIYRVKKTELMDEKYFEFISKISELLYDTDFIKRMGITSVHSFDFYSNFPCVNVSCYTVLEDIWFSYKEVENMFYAWCLRNDIQAGTIDLDCTDGLMLLSFKYSGNPNPFGLFDKEEKNSLAYFSVDMDTHLAKGKRWWSYDDSHMFWLRHKESIPKEVYPKSVSNEIGDVKKVKERYQDVVEDEFSSGFIRYTLNNDHDLVRLTGFRPPLPYNAIYKLTGIMSKVVKDNPYLDEMTLPDDGKNLVSLFDTIQGNYVCFSYEIPVDFNTFSVDRNIVLDYLKNSLRESLVAEGFEEISMEIGLLDDNKIETSFVVPVEKS